MAASMPRTTASSAPDDPRFSRPPPTTADLQRWARWHLAAQAAACAPLYAELLGRAADDVRAEGPA
ncbi:MAG: hypothetical protein M3415_01385 [Actinomycetota bacterium]|nr:hypothetical protein [Actinomycetota bacterium]